MAQTVNYLEEDDQTRAALDKLGSKAVNIFKRESAEFAKLEITPFMVKKEGGTVDFSSKKVTINPASYNRSFEAVTRNSNCNKTADGQQATQKIVDFTEKIDFELWFDSTGAIPGSRDVAEDIEWLRENLSQYDGDIHSTRFVRLSWGGLQFEGQLKNMTVNYLYFNRNGDPLRAKATLNFEELVDQKVQARKKNPKSPDLTHVRTIRDGDTLPLLCYEIYNNPAYYIQVAEANGLSNFTNIQAGQIIYFPPLV